MQASLGAAMMRKDWLGEAGSDRLGEDWRGKAGMAWPGPARHGRQSYPEGAGSGISSQQQESAA